MGITPSYAPFFSPGDLLFTSRCKLSFLRRSVLSVPYTFTFARLFHGLQQCSWRNYPVSVLVWYIVPTIYLELPLYNLQEYLPTPPIHHRPTRFPVESLVTFSRGCRKRMWPILSWLVYRSQRYNVLPVYPQNAGMCFTDVMYGEMFPFFSYGLFACASVCVVLPRC